MIVCGVRFIPNKAMYAEKEITSRCYLTASQLFSFFASISLQDLLSLKVFVCDSRIKKKKIVLCS